MGKKPRLTVIGPSATTGDGPPTTLGKAGTNLWRSVMAEYQIVDSGGLSMLEQACAARDRISECAAIIAAEGAVVRTKMGPKEHPLLKIELASRAFLVRTLARLGLDVEPIRPTGRPPLGDD
jgi:P27 family predicted phage terminase small subunit